MMRYLVDTNIVSFAVRNQHGIEERLKLVAVTDFLLSAVVLAEGCAGAYKHRDPQRMLRLWNTYVGQWTVVPFDAGCAHHYGRIRAQLEQRGCMIGTHDCEIAATALAWAEANPDEPVTVVTDNVEEFRRVPGLVVDNWVVR